MLQISGLMLVSGRLLGFLPAAMCACVCGVGQAMMTAAEVLISLHSVDAAKDGVPLRKVMACLDPCMNQDMRAAFPPESMAVALQQLVTRSVHFLHPQIKTSNLLIIRCNQLQCPSVMSDVFNRSNSQCCNSIISVTGEQLVCAWQLLVQLLNYILLKLFVLACLGVACYAQAHSKLLCHTVGLQT